VPHERRRELRGLRVFGAWTNLVDMKAGNTLDVLVDKDGRSIVKHYLQDVGSSLGMANNQYEWDMGWEHFYDPDPSRRRLMTLGFWNSTSPTEIYTEYPSVGRFEGERFDPDNVEAADAGAGLCRDARGRRLRAARRVMAFSDER
jgi:hypothetical protein